MKCHLTSSQHLLYAKYLLSFLWNLKPQSFCIFLQCTKQCTFKYYLHSNESRASFRFHSFSVSHNCSKILVSGSDYYLRNLYVSTLHLVLLYPFLYFFPFNFDHPWLAELNHFSEFAVATYFPFYIFLLFTS